MLSGSPALLTGPRLGTYVRGRKAKRKRLFECGGCYKQATPSGVDQAKPDAADQPHGALLSTEVLREDRMDELDDTEQRHRENHPEGSPSRSNSSGDLSRVVSAAGCKGGPAADRQQDWQCQHAACEDAHSGEGIPQKP